jgi:phosphoadenosine phosphosulfate reductase
MYKTEWLIHSKTREYSRHLEYARDDIKRAMDKGSFVISWSTGKDSTAMCHLIKSMYVDTPIMIQFDDCDWPEKREYADEIINKYGWGVNEIIPSFSVWGLAQKSKIGYDDLCSQSSELTQESFIKLLEKERIQLGCIGSFLGLRAEESRGRMLNLATRGELYQVTSGQWRCCPLGRWTVLDVFAYLASNKVPINPCYFYNEINKPENIRLSWALPTPQGARRGDIEHIRRYYPEQYRRLRDNKVI